MSKIVLYILMIISVLFYSCGNNSDKDQISTKNVYNPNSAEKHAKKVLLPEIKFNEEVHDFGKLIQGEQVSFAFKFKNVGNADLIIASVSTSCGCTVPTFPERPIHPGEEAIIDVKFDSNGRIGFQNKTITIVSNTQPNTKILRIKAVIYIPEKN